ncbi:peptidase family M20 [Streptococcus uberis 6780]|uniref:M20/M25/M40 family metallo-hydrolase n=1 Tax=Streptococcus uberis TaxID=1349 RepID=UPI00062041C2|nr:M20/M25/M40 family metallo-hydrolase [Streptococcus uberis]KKF56725.1 peptidase family M20 [Streptococcus uberis 6780]
MNQKTSQLSQKIFESNPVITFYIDKLNELLSIKSIFAQDVGLEEAANFLSSLFKEAGAEVTLDKSFKAPFLIARFKSSSPNAKTLLFYNHYDTVPADSDQRWHFEPFTLSIKENKMYGRGVDDDKGHIIARLTAVINYLNNHKDLPINVTFIMEGAEESASVDLESYLLAHQEELSKADLLIWEQGIKNEKNQLELTGGNKGILTFDMAVKSADSDIHSKYGGVVDSATWYLLRAISSLRDDQGHLLVDGIYDKIKPANQRELALVEQFAVENPEIVKKLYGLSLPMLQSDRRAFLRRYYFEPSVTIQGISSGYLGSGVKTIIPSYASAKMEIRLVPGLDPKEVFEAVSNHLRVHGFGLVELNYTLGEKSYRSDLSSPEVQALIDLVSLNHPGGVCLLPTSAGTGPMHTVYSVLKVPMVSLGMGNPNSSDHSGDENVLISDYLEHITLIEELIKSYE